jgi:hypothetical protein
VLKDKSDELEGDLNKTAYRKRINETIFEQKNENGIGM